MRSAWRGVARNAPAPKRSRSKRDAPTAIISIAQHASPNVIGQSEFFLAQLIAKSRLVTIRPSSKRFSIQDMSSAPFCERDQEDYCTEGGPAQALGDFNERCPLPASGLDWTLMNHQHASASRLVLLAASAFGLTVSFSTAGLRADDVSKDNRELRDLNRELE